MNDKNPIYITLSKVRDGGCWAECNGNYKDSSIKTECAVKLNSSLKGLINKDLYFVYQ